MIALKKGTGLSEVFYVSGFFALAASSERKRGRQFRRGSSETSVEHDEDEVETER